MTILFRRARVNGECVDPAGKFARERLVDHPMAIDPALPFEGLRYDMHSVVSFAAGPGARVPGMQVRLICNVETRGSKCPREHFDDSIPPDHSGRLAAGVRLRQPLICPEKPSNRSCQVLRDDDRAHHNDRA